MQIKDQLAYRFSFIDFNVRFQPIDLPQPIEIWKLLIEVEVKQKIKSPFKILVKYKDNIDDKSDGFMDTFEFDDRDADRKMIHGNPFLRDDTLVNHILLEYLPEIKSPLIMIKVFVYEIDEGSREDLHTFGSTK